MSPAPTARARPSPSCARSWKPRASACTSIPRRIWCASTSASGSAQPGEGKLVADEELRATLEECERVNAGAADHRVRDHHRGRACCCSRAIRPTCCCWKSASAAGSTPPMWSMRPLATVITPISIDHTDFLGDTLEKIAAEKAGILKRGVPAIVAAQHARRARRDRTAGGAAQCAAEDRRRGLDRDRGARPAGLSGRRRPARSAGAEALRPPSVRECRARHRGAARDRAVEDCAGRLRSRHGQGRLAGAAAAAGARPAGRAGARRQRAVARRRPQSRRRPRHRRGARRSRGARVASAGADRRHAGEQGLRRVS